MSRIDVSMKRGLLTLALVLGAAAFQLAGLARAAGPIVVNSAADTAAAGDGRCTLREAITNANADADTTGGDCPAGSGNDVIVFAGAYTITLNGALPAITHPLEIDGVGMDNTIIQASSCDPTTLPGGCTPAGDRVFYVDAFSGSNTGSLTLNGLTIRNGSCHSACVSGATGRGGAIFSMFGSVSLNGARLAANSADSCGALDVENAMLTISSGSVITGNHADSYAGGLCIHNVMLTLSGSTVSDNVAGDIAGGMYIQGVANITNNSLISGNTAGSDGGGMYWLGSALTISGSRVIGNTSAGAGGGLYALNAGTASVTGSCIVGNIGSGLVSADSNGVTATGNWWGSAYGPASAETPPFGDSVSGSVTTSGYLTAPVLGCGFAGPELQPDHASLSFPPELVNTTSSPITVTLTNSGRQSLSVSSIAAYGVYSVSQDVCTGAPVAPGGQCSFAVSFAPITIGSQPGVVVVGSNGLTNPLSIPLSGVGLSPASPPVLTAPKDGMSGVKPPKLTWKAVGGAPGYHVEVDNNADFASPEQAGDVVKPFYQTTALPFGVYFWHVAYKENFGQGAYSAPFSFEVTLNKAPKKNAVLKNGLVKFSWAGIKGQTYLLRITNEAAHTVFFQTPSPLSKPIFTVDKTAPLPSGSYSWQVSIDGGSSWTPAWGFSIP